MKKTLLILLFCLPFLFSACSSDNDDAEPTPPPVPEEIKKDYTIKFSVKPTTEDKTVEINLSGSEFTINWGDGTIEDIKPKDKESQPYKHQYKADGVYDMIISTEELTAIAFMNLANSNVSNTTTDIHINDCPKLRRIYTNESINPSKIDVSKCPQLTSLSLFGSNLSSIDVSKNPELEILTCTDSKLTTLDIRNNTKLTSLDCNGNLLSNLDISNNPNISSLTFSKNPSMSSINGLDKIAKKIVSLGFGQTKIKINLQDYPNLEYLSCNDLESKALDIKTNTKLIYLSCENSNLSALDISNQPDLRFLLCYGNLLSSIDISNNKNIQILNCRNNKLDAEALNQILNSLPNIPDMSGHIDIKGNPGSDTYDKSIPLESKGWRLWN